MSFDSPVPLTKADLPLQPERPTNARFGTLSWLCMAATIAYVCRNSFGPLESTIRKDLQIDETTMGYIISSFFLRTNGTVLDHSWVIEERVEL